MRKEEKTKTLDLSGMPSRHQRALMAFQAYNYREALAIFIETANSGYLPAYVWIHLLLNDQYPGIKVNSKWVVMCETVFSQYRQFSAQQVKLSRLADWQSLFAFAYVQHQCFDQRKHYVKDVLTLYNKACGMMPCAVIYRKFADFLTKIGRTKTAIMHYKQAIKFDPQDLIAYLNLGHISKLYSRMEEAKDYYLEAKALYPHYAPNYWFLAELSRLNYRYQEALLYYDKCVELDPRNPKISQRRDSLIQQLQQINFTSDEMEQLELSVITQQGDLSRADLSLLHIKVIGAKLAKNAPIEALCFDDSPLTEAGLEIIAWSLETNTQLKAISFCRTPKLCHPTKLTQAQRICRQVIHNKLLENKKLTSPKKPMALSSDLFKKIDSLSSMLNPQCTITENVWLIALAHVSIDYFKMPSLTKIDQSSEKETQNTEHPILASTQKTAIAVQLNSTLFTAPVPKNTDDTTAQLPCRPKTTLALSSKIQPVLFLEMLIAKAEKKSKEKEGRNIFAIYIEQVTDEQKHGTTIRIKEQQIDSTEAQHICRQYALISATTGRQLFKEIKKGQVNVLKIAEQYTIGGGQLYSQGWLETILRELDINLIDMATLAISSVARKEQQLHSRVTH